MSKTRELKHQKRKAKEGTFPWRAKEDIYMQTIGGTRNVAFEKGKVYDMHVAGYYAYKTSSEHDESHFITREWLSSNFEEVTNA